MTFEECVLECAANEDLVSEFNRLLGCHLGKSNLRAPIEIAIDEATGYCPESEGDMRTFIAFVYDVVWTRIPRGLDSTGE